MKEGNPDLRWRTALEAVADGVWDWDIHSDETYFSPEGLEIWGYNPGGPTPSTDEIFSRVHPDDLPDLKERIEAYLSGALDRYEQEFRVVDPAGTTRWVLGRGCAIERDDDGRPIRMLGTNVDITGRKESEDRLLLQQGQREAAQEMARLGYWTFDLATEQPSWSEMMFELLGWDPQKGTPSYKQHQEIIHPDDWGRFDEAVQGAIGGVPYDVELRVPFPDGSIHFVRARGYSEIGSTGKVESLFGVTQDITEAKRREDALREQEALFRGTFEQAAVGMVQAGHNGSWIRVNQRLCQMLGYERGELMELDFSSVTHPEDRSRSHEHFRKVMEGRVEAETWRKRYVRKDGSVLWAQLTGSTVRDGEGEPPYYLGIIVDISAQVKAERRLQESRTRLRTLNEQLDQVREDERARLSREIHDDLGQHLTAVRMDLDRLAAEFGHLSPELQRKVREIGAFVDQGVQISRNISSGLQSPVLELLGLVEAVRSVAEESSARAGLDLHLDLPSRDPNVPKGQKKTLFRIVKEALANASQHSGGSELQVGIRANPDGLVVTVQDDGVGIPAEILESPRSFGLLSMSERARSMGASFIAERRVEGGTRVRIFLPANEGA